MSHPCHEFTSFECDGSSDCCARRATLPAEAPEAAPALKDLLSHARRLGIEGVAETAAEHLGPADVARVKVELVGIAKEHKQKRSPSSWWSDVPAITADDVEALARDGLTGDEISSLTGRSRAFVYSALSEKSETVASRRVLARK